MLGAKADAAKREITVEDLLIDDQPDRPTRKRIGAKVGEEQQLARYTLTRRLEEPPGTSIKATAPATHICCRRF